MKLSDLFNKMPDYVYIKILTVLIQKANPFSIETHYNV